MEEALICCQANSRTQIVLASLHNCGGVISVLISATDTAVQIRPTANSLVSWFPNGETLLALASTTFRNLRVMKGMTKGNIY